MSELQEKINNIINLDEARYFYHITSSSGDEILENGLYVANPSWQQSFLEFNEYELSNIDEIIDDNTHNKIKNNQTMIIVGIYKDSSDNFIRKINDYENNDVNFEGVGSADYIVDSKYIIGYIDMMDRELYLNDYADVVTDSYGL